MSLSPTQYKFRHSNGAGQVLWASGIGDLDGSIIRGSKQELELIGDQPWFGNALADEGEEQILDVYFRAATAPVNFYLRLYNDTPTETDTLATLTNEVSGTGYAAIELDRNNTDFPTLALDGGDFKVTSSLFTYTAGGNWTAATYIVLATTAPATTGKLVAYSALSATRTLVNADTLDVTFSMKLS